MSVFIGLAIFVIAFLFIAYKTTNTCPDPKTKNSQWLYARLESENNWLVLNKLNANQEEYEKHYSYCAALKEEIASRIDQVKQTDSMKNRILISQMLEDWMPKRLAFYVSNGVDEIDAALLAEYTALLMVEKFTASNLENATRLELLKNEIERKDLTYLLDIKPEDIGNAIKRKRIKEANKGTIESIANPLADAERAYDFGYYTKAAELFKAAAERGNALAQLKLAEMYSEGQGVPLNHFESAKWFGLSAEQGNAVAQRIFGLMRFQGQNTKQDYKEALKWYQLSAEQGDTEALFRITMMYRHGQGIPEDIVRAYMWAKIAANTHHDSGETILKIKPTYFCELANMMTTDQIAEAEKLFAEHMGGLPSTDSICVKG